MGQLRELLGNRIVAAALVLLSSAIALLRFIPTLPTVMQDEYVYLIQAKSPLSENEFGNFLHSLIYGSTLEFGLEFYTATKVLNTVFLAAFALAVMFTARLVISAGSSTLIGISVPLGATGLYASVFMPEVLFFALASWSIFFFVKSLTKSDISFSNYAVGLLLLSITGLAKPHAFIMMFGMILSLLMLAIDGRLARLRAAILSLATVVGYVLLKLLFGFLLAGSQGLTILGANYERALSSFLERLLAFSEGALSASAGNPNPVDAVSFPQTVFFTLVQSGLVFSTFVVMTAGALVLILRHPSKLDVYQILIICVSVTYIFAVSAFTALVTFAGEDHSDRILGRYFEFLVPFVLVAAVVEIDKRAKVSRLRAWVVGGVLLISFLLWLIILIGGRFQLADSAYLLGISSNPSFSALLALSAIALVLILARRPKNAIALALITIIGSSIVVGSLATQQQINLNSGKVGADIAGEILFENFGDYPDEEIVVLGSQDKLTFMPAFWSQKQFVDQITLRTGSVVDIRDELLTPYTLFVILDDVSMIGGQTLFQGEDFSIITRPAGPG